MRIFAHGWSDGFDGPGRRLVDYLKGCNLRRTWCGNPESIAAVPEMLFYSEKSAFAAGRCPHSAVRDGLLDRRVCARCEDHACTDRWRDPRGGQEPLMLSAAGSLRWFRDALAPGEAFGDLAARAGEVGPGADGLLFLPYLSGERSPYPDPLAGH